MGGDGVEPREGMTDENCAVEPHGTPNSPTANQNEGERRRGKNREMQISVENKQRLHLQEM